MSMQYKNGNGVPPSSVGPQFSEFYYHRKALIDLQRDMYFGQLADTMTMPKHFGKKIKLYHYIPLLDDRNFNDQGIDATGATTSVYTYYLVIKDADGGEIPFQGEGASSGAAQTAAETKAEDWLKNRGLFNTDLATSIAALTGWSTSTQTVNAPVGNLYGSSRDVGTISGKLPTISENGGRVNRVGFTRVTLEGEITNFGFFDEYTEDAMQFDTDSELMSHITRETTRAANYMNEDMIQMDLLNGAGVVVYGGNATSVGTLTGENGATKSILDYDLLLKTEAILNDNLCPKDTKLISGSRMTDTKTIGAARYAFVGSELKPVLLKMTDPFGQAAFVPVQQYAAAGNIANGEIGSIGGFRFIENPDMMHWDGVGANVVTNDGFYESNGKYNAYPVLIVGSGSFTTIGFQTSGTGSKFKIMHKAPGEGVASKDDPYGKTGFYSIQWWYGSMVLRPEWIACIKVVAPR